MKKNLLKILIVVGLIWDLSFAMENDLYKLSKSQNDDFIQLKITYSLKCECGAEIKGQEGTEENIQNREQFSDIVDNKKDVLEKELESLILEYEDILPPFTSNSVELDPALEVEFHFVRGLELKDNIDITKAHFDVIYKLLRGFKLLIYPEDIERYDQFDNKLTKIMSQLLGELGSELFPHINLAEEGPSIIFYLELLMAKNYIRRSSKIKYNMLQANNFIYAK